MAEHEIPHPDLGGYVLGVLEPEEAEAFEAHLAGCPDCRREVTDLSDLPDLLAQAAPPVEVPADLRERTMAAVERAAQEDEARGGAPAPTPAPVRRRARQRQRQRRPYLVDVRKVLAVAAAVVALGGAFAVVREGVRPAPAVAQVVELEAPPGRSGRAVARVRTTDTGGAIELEVEGLPQAPPGFHFECWLVSAQGDNPQQPNRVSVGTFNVDEQGRAKVRWDFTADTEKFPRMGVTLEPDDGNPVQTTDRVLAAKRLL